MSEHAMRVRAWQEHNDETTKMLPNSQRESAAAVVSAFSFHGMPVSCLKFFATMLAVPRLRHTHHASRNISGSAQACRQHALPCARARRAVFAGARALFHHRLKAQKESASQRHAIISARAYTGICALHNMREGEAI